MATKVVSNMRLKAWDKQSEQVRKLVVEWTKAKGTPNEAVVLNQFLEKVLPIYKEVPHWSAIYHPLRYVKFPLSLVEALFAYWRVHQSEEILLKLTIDMFIHYGKVFVYDEHFGCP